MSTVKPKEDTFNRLLVIKDSALERATYGNPWQKHGIRPAPKENKRRAIDTAKTYADKQRQQRKEMCRRRRLKKPQSAINMMEKQESSASKQDSSDDEQFPEKPDMHIFSLVDDNSDDDLGEVDAHAIQYMRRKSNQRRLVLQAYESSKEHKKEALRILHAPEVETSGSIFDWTFD
eukprot:TRINITY_DN242_c0_g1_i8.p1 TRINITY_DN242_c0_g1~~TRINITY_DN242_c0_g1_i8.p1  ORF type:complete len:176 (-),score=35.20 TRINITY_DN242_c0_g1_i8:75-602(-)